MEVLLISGVIIVWLFLEFSDRTIKDLEKYLIKNLSGVCYLLVFLFGGAGLDGKLDEEFALTAIGAILVFWYGYKTYERDKEIEMISKFSDRYNLIIEKIRSLKANDDGLILLHFQLINLWYDEYHLYVNGYLSDSLWNEWSSWIKSDIFYFLGILPSTEDRVIVPGLNIPIFLVALNRQASSGRHTKESSWIGFLSFLHKEANILVESCLLLTNKSKEKIHLSKAKKELSDLEIFMSQGDIYTELFNSHKQLEYLESKNSSKLKV